LQLLGLLADNVGKYDVAERLMRRSLSVQPSQPAVLSNLGSVL
jgi:Flp pilus assembly protein TadD